MQRLCTQNLQLVENLEALAKEKGVTPGQLALAWVLARGDDVIPIPGTKRVACVDENVTAVRIRLSPQELQELEDAVPHHQV
jgi:aryl-alcohol dehydrogenase-like predicted oxidoreductase